MDGAKSRPKPSSHCLRWWRGFTPAARAGSRVSYLAPPCGSLYAGGKHYQFSTLLLLSLSSPALLLTLHILMRSLGTLPWSCVQTEVLSSQQYYALDGTKFNFDCCFNYLECRETLNSTPNCLKWVISIHIHIPRVTSVWDGSTK